MNKYIIKKIFKKDKIILLLNIFFEIFKNSIIEKVEKIIKLYIRIKSNLKIKINTNSNNIEVKILFL